MKIQIKYVKDAGNIDKERVVLKVLDNNVNIGNYIVCDTTYISENEISNKLRHIFWFPDHEVKKGDLIVIYTKTGIEKTMDNKSGNITHFFYWELDRTVWNIDEDAVTLISIKDWISKKVST